MAVLHAIAQFHGRVKLQIIGYTTMGHSHYLTSFLAEAERLQLTHAVEYCGAVPRHSLPGLTARCDVGLAFMPLHGGDINTEEYDRGIQQTL